VTQKIARILAKLDALFGRGQVITMGIILLTGLLLSVAISFS